MVWDQTTTKPAAKHTRVSSVPTNPSDILLLLSPILRTCCPNLLWVEFPYVTYCYLYIFTFTPLSSYCSGPITNPARWKYTLALSRVMDLEARKRLLDVQFTSLLSSDSGSIIRALTGIGTNGGDCETLKDMLWHREYCTHLPWALSGSLCWRLRVVSQ